jgi:hypothetical protein
LTFGAQLKSIQFVRSNFDLINPAASELNNDIRVSDKYFTDSNPPQIVKSPLAIEEDLTYFNLVAGLGYNSAFAVKRKKLTWRVGAELALPMLATAKNSALEQQYGVESIEGNFNGYEMRLSAGLNYEFKKGLAVSMNADYNVAAYDEINTSVKAETGSGIVNRTAAIPDIEMSSFQLTLGVTWIN